MLVILFCGFSVKSCTIPSDNVSIVQNKNKKLIKMPDIQWDGKKKPGLQATICQPSSIRAEQFTLHLLSGQQKPRNPRV